MTDPNGWPDEARKVVAEAIGCAILEAPHCDAARYLAEADAALTALAPFVAAREAAAAEAMREACVAWLELREKTSRSFGHHADAYDIAARNLGLLPPPSASDALARIRAEARREGMEMAADILQKAGMTDAELLVRRAHFAAKDIKP
jgi:hypothetical protein